MVVGRPFQRGEDPRRGTAPPPPPNRRRDKPDDLIRYVRKSTKYGRSLVDWLVAIAEGTAVSKRQVATKEGGVVDLEERPSHKERLAAIRELWDRGMGTAVAPDKMPEPEQAASGESESDTDLEPPKLDAA